MNTPERRAHSLELKRQHALEYPTTSNYAAMFATPRVDQPSSDETGAHSDEDIRALNDANARDPAEPRLGTVDVQQAQIRNDRVSSDSERHKAPSAEPAVIHFSHPRVPRFNISIKLSRSARKDEMLFSSDCVRIRTPNNINDAGSTRGELQMNPGGVYVESEKEKDVRFARENEVGDLAPAGIFGAHPGIVGAGIIVNIDGNIDGDDGEYINVNNTDADIESQDSRRPYLVLGLLSTGTSIPKEEMRRIKSPTRLFKELRKAASKLRPWPIRILSLKSESGFAIYECTEQGVHKRVLVDQSTQHILGEMFRAYNTRRRDVDSRWLSFVHEELNGMDSNPRLGKYSLQLVLGWSALKLVIWGSTSILLSLVIGFWYMFKSHPGEDPVAIVQTAWGISSYIITAGAPIAILAAVTQIGNN